jgi:hypothetical protein
MPTTTTTQEATFSRAVHLGFVVDKVVLGQVILRVLSFPLSHSFY